MAIDPSAVGSTGGPVERSWTSKDCLLYALGVGAGLDELSFNTEKNQQVLPTTVVVLGARGAVPMQKIGSFNPAMLVHGEQAIELARPLPPDGTVQTTGKIAAVYDKGKGAVVVSETEARDAKTNELMWTTRSAAFIRGAGGFGGDRGPSGPINEPPARKPDHEVTYRTLPEQALLYRLSGDRNPLHSDPEFARVAGFQRPILHGLCTYGFTGRALLHTLCGSDPARFKSMAGRFSKPVFPGEALTISMWVDGQVCLFQTRNERGETVLDQGRMTFA
ncbi:MAG TPA: MaoC/PaaZ C-terminal domain-containing protein [Polyangiales bacterium]|nr:MaoC/PaaZ C-terminal domain-containing protein [Polyangiales bacterium]